ncbi:MAG: Card1-like endonuclease domain-containing protein [Blastocatellia bacterium]
MINPVQKALELEQLIERVLMECRMADGPREKVELALIRAFSISNMLADVHSNIVPLDLDEPTPPPGQFWQEAHDGPIGPEEDLFSRIIENSQTLECIRRAGVDIQGINKFSEKELELARGLGARFHDWHWGILGIRKSLNGGRLDCEVQSHRSRFESMRDLLVYLKRREIIGEFSFLHYDDNGVAATEKTVEQIRQIRQKRANIGYKFSMLNRQHSGFLTGDWFTAYVYQLIAKYLATNKASHELYPRVIYKSPREITRSDGDFDIIGKIENKLLLVECKSGNLEHDLNKLIEKTNMLKKVLKNAKVGIDEFIFWLVYNPLAKDNNQIATHAAAHGIKTVKPEEIRDSLVTLYAQR